MATSLFEHWSPEYALNKAFDDMRKSGLDGLKNISQRMLSRTYRD